MRSEPSQELEAEEREEKPAEEPKEKWWEKHSAFIKTAKTARFPKYPDPIEVLIAAYGVQPKTASAYSSSLQRFINANVRLRKHRMDREDHPDQYQMQKDKDKFYKVEGELMRGVRDEEIKLKQLEGQINSSARQVAAKLREAVEIKIIKSNPRKRRNDGIKESWFSTAGIRNWLILAAVLVGGYIIYRKFVAPKLNALPAPPKGSLPAPRAPAGMRVTANQVASTDSTSLIGGRRPGYDYARILSTKSDGSREFVPSTDGVFTGNLLNEGGGLWAEIQPT
jgi:hypothetical protein